MGSRGLGPLSSAALLRRTVPALAQGAGGTGGASGRPYRALEPRGEALAMLPPTVPDRGEPRFLPVSCLPRGWAMARAPSLFPDGPPAWMGQGRMELPGVRPALPSGCQPGTRGPESPGVSPWLRGRRPGPWGLARPETGPLGPQGGARAFEARSPDEVQVIAGRGGGRRRPRGPRPMRGVAPSREVGGRALEGPVATREALGSAGGPESRTQGMGPRFPGQPVLGRHPERRPTPPGMPGTSPGVGSPRPGAGRTGWHRKGPRKLRELRRTSCVTHIVGGEQAAA